MVGCRPYKTRTAKFLIDCFKKGRSTKFIGELIFKNTLRTSRENEIKVYVNQGIETLSHIRIRRAYNFSSCFPHELLMIFE